jgi:hypothetical protein
VATVKMFAFVVPSLLVQSLPLADLLVAIGVAIHSQPASIGHSWKDRFDYGGDGVRGTRRSRAPDPCRYRAGLGCPEAAFARYPAEPGSGSISCASTYTGLV